MAKFHSVLKEQKYFSPLSPDVVRFVGQLPRIFNLDIDNLGNALPQVVGDAFEDGRPGVPKATLEPNNNGRSIHAHVVDAARYADAAILGSVAKERNELAAAGRQYAQNCFLRQVKLRAWMRVRRTRRT